VSIPEHPRGRMAAQVNATFRDWSCSWPTRADPPIWADAGSSPITTLDVQICAFCAPPLARPYRQANGV